MSTLHSMNLALVDLEDRLMRELQFSHDAEKQILDALAIVKDGLEQLDRSIRAAFQERNRALSAAIGTGRPNPETVDADPQPAPKRPKLVKEVADA
jgi:hypothetical protein